MKKIVICLMFTMLMTFGFSVGMAKKNPVTELTGEVWIESTKDNKLALLYGVECAVSMEYVTAKYKAEQGGKSTKHQDIVDELTPFSRSWILAFSDAKREKIVEEIDAWYAKNQDKLDIPVFNVVWHEVIEPKLKTR